MKVAVVFIVVAVAIASAQQEKCVGTCSSSQDCALGAGSLQCRCSYLQCKWIEGNCGGGCLTDAQCQEWAQGDPTCICSWGECARESDMKYPAYKEFLKQLAMVKQREAAKKLAENKA